MEIFSAGWARPAPPSVGTSLIHIKVKLCSHGEVLGVETPSPHDQSLKNNSNKPIITINTITLEAQTLHHYASGDLKRQFSYPEGKATPLPKLIHGFVNSGYHNKLVQSIPLYKRQTSIFV